MTRLHSLPSSVLARILARLSYESLLRMTRVCRRWRVLVASRNELQVRLFRESCSSGPKGLSTDVLNLVPRSLLLTSVELHPVLQPYRVHYIIGSLAENTRIIAFHPDAPPTTRLFHCPVASELITQPSQAMIDVCVKYLGSFTLAREDGVRVKDLFVTLQERFCYLRSPTSEGEQSSQYCGSAVCRYSLLFAGAYFTDSRPGHPSLFVVTDRLTSSQPATCHAPLTT